MSAEESTEIGWAILELMGHRKLAGFVSDDNGLVRIDVYTEPPKRRCEACNGLGGSPEEGACCECGGDGDNPRPPIATQWYGRAAIYCITASTMDMCLRLAQSHQPAPVGHWELEERAQTPAMAAHLGEDDDVDDADLEPDDWEGSE